MEIVRILINVHVEGTDTFLDRETEVRNFKILSDNSFGIELLKTFPGGRLELWRDGYEFHRDSGNLVY